MMRRMNYPQDMNEAVAAPPAGRLLGTALPDPEGGRERVPPAEAGMGDAVFGAHRGPLTVTDNFAVLDDPVEQRDFTEYAEVDGRALAESVLMVQGMYCAACADTVECALQDVPGVEQAQVHAATRRLTVRWDPARVRMSHLAQLIGETGYRLLPMQQALSISERLRETRRALWRLVCGRLLCDAGDDVRLAGLRHRPRRDSGRYRPVVALGQLVAQPAGGVFCLRDPSSAAPGET